MVTLGQYLYGDEKPSRKRLGKLEWDSLKAFHHNKCVICGVSERTVGTLQQAHLKAHHKGGTQILPMCANCHGKYDKGQCTATELRKIGQTPQQNHRLRPKTAKSKPAPKDTKSSKANAKVAQASKRRKSRVSDSLTFFG